MMCKMYLVQYLLLCFVFIALKDLTVNAIIPDYIRVCHRNDPKLNECIMKSVEVIRPKLREGIPELKVPPMEPLDLGNIVLRRGPQSSRVDLNLTQLQAWGPSTFITKSVTLNIEKNIFEFHVTIPKLHFKGKYSINMNVLLLRLKGKGNVNGDFATFDVRARMYGQKITNKNTNSTHLHFNKIKIILNIGQAKLNLEELFADDPLLSRVANDVVQENSDVFIEEIRPALQSSLGDVFTKIANAITRSFTYDELFPL